jgi:hypothetical protein
MVLTLEADQPIAIKARLRKAQAWNRLNCLEDALDCYNVRACGRAVVVVRLLFMPLVEGGWVTVTVTVLGVCRLWWRWTLPTSRPRRS